MPWWGGPGRRACRCSRWTKALRVVSTWPWITGTAFRRSWSIWFSSTATAGSILWEVCRTMIFPWRGSGYIWRPWRPWGCPGSSAGSTMGVFGRLPVKRPWSRCFRILSRDWKCRRPLSAPTIPWPWRYATVCVSRGTRCRRMWRSADLTAWR